MTSLIEQGMPLGEGLRALSTEIGDAKLRVALGGIADDLNAGVSLDHALAAQGNRIPPRWRALFQSGLRSGRLAELTADLVADRELTKHIQRQLALQLFYPCLLLTVCTGLFMFMTMAVGGEYATLFSDFGMNVSWPLLHMLRFSSVIAESGIWLVTSPVLLAIAGFLVFRFGLNAPDRSQILHRLPLFGPIYRSAALSDFCRSLAWLLRGQVPFDEALTLTASCTDDAALAGNCRQVVFELQQGRTIAQALSEQRGFPSGFARFVSWACALPNPADAFSLASSLFEERAKLQGRFAATFLGSLAIALALWWTALAATILLWPLFQLLTGLSG
jgi:type II secretory pathway component PulF